MNLAQKRNTEMKVNIIVATMLLATMFASTAFAYAISTVCNGGTCRNIMSAEDGTIV